MRSIAIFLICMLALIFLAACTDEQAISVSLQSRPLAQEALPFQVSPSPCWDLGFDRRLQPKEDVRQVASLAGWLAQQTGLTWCVHMTPPDTTLVDELCNEQADFAIMGTVSYLQANHQCGVRILARGLNRNGEDTYQAAIVVPVGSPTQTLDELRGRSFAFGAPNSTQGYLIPRLMLQDAGLELQDFRFYTFNESHAATANAVTSGRFDAGALQDTLAYSLAERGLVRILAVSDPYPASGVVAGPNVPAKTVMITLEALLRLQPLGADATALYHWERSEMPHGFVRATDADYVSLRRLAYDIGLVEP